MVLFIDAQPTHLQKGGAYRITMKNKTQESIAADWAGRGFSCGLWVDPPGKRWEGYTHAVDELIVVLEGTMEFEVSGTVIHPEPGEEIRVPAGAVHSARNSG